MPSRTATYTPSPHGCGGDGTLLCGIGDLGSNGLRFSISSVDPKDVRIMPLLYQTRSQISLLDAQLMPATALSGRDSPPEDSMVPDNNKTHNKDNNDNSPPTDNEISTFSTSSSSSLNQVAIPDSVIDKVVTAILRFKIMCQDFGVPDANVKLVATEAIRLAINKDDLLSRVKEATDYDIRLLSKSEEGTIGVYGVASSFYKLDGLFMDLGGGSTQLSWARTNYGEVDLSPTPISLPYGAATLTRRLEKEPRDKLFEEIVTNYKQAYKDIHVPEEMRKQAEKNGGFKIYVSGGGFRGLASLLLATIHQGPGGAYPLPIINGFSCSYESLLDLVRSKQYDGSATSTINGISGGNKRQMEKVFRISERRATQIPAVCFLVEAILQSIPPVKRIFFAQGGVREGVIYSSLPPSIRIQDPILVATAPYAPKHASKITMLISEALPMLTTPSVIRCRILPAAVNMMLYHSSFHKESQPKAAIVLCSTGVVAASQGLSHEVRALLGLTLCERWGGDLPDTTYRDALMKVVADQRNVWWSFYLGRILYAIASIYPAGVIPNQNPRVRLGVSNINSRGDFTLNVETRMGDPVTTAVTTESRLVTMEKKFKRFSKDLGKHSYKVNVNLQKTL